MSPHCVLGWGMTAATVPEVDAHDSFAHTARFNAVLAAALNTCEDGRLLDWRQIERLREPVHVYISAMSRDESRSFMMEWLLRLALEDPWMEPQEAIKRLVAASRAMDTNRSPVDYVDTKRAFARAFADSLSTLDALVRTRRVRDNCEEELNCAEAFNRAVTADLMTYGTSVGMDEEVIDGLTTLVLAASHAHREVALARRPEKPIQSDRMFTYDLLYVAAQLMGHGPVVSYYRPAASL